MWSFYRCQMEFENIVCGSVPQSKDLVRPWLEARMPKVEPDEGIEKTIEEMQQEILETIAEVEERTSLGFQRDGSGLFIRGGTLKAHLKDCANNVKDAKGVKIKNFKYKFQSRCFVTDYRVYLTDSSGEVVQEESGKYEQPVHFQTRLGMQNALKIIGFVERPLISFMIQVADDGIIKQGDLEVLFEYGSIHGYGGERGMGEGRYFWDVQSAELAKEEVDSYRRRLPPADGGVRKRKKVA